MTNESFGKLHTPYKLPSKNPVTFSNRLLNAAGCWSTTHEELDALLASASGGIVSKSCTSLPQDDELSTHARGLQNEGMSAYTVFGELHPGTKPYIVSVTGMTYGENMEIVHTLQSSYHKHVDAIELDLLCPNVPDKPLVAYDFESMREVVRQVCAARKDACEQYQIVSQSTSTQIVPIGLKLPAYFTQAQFKSLAEVLDDYISEIAFVSCINMTRTHLKNSETTKQLGLANVRALHELLPSLPIFGCGGIATANDAEEYLAAGASMVQVGTALVHEGPSVFSRLLRGYDAEPDTA